MATTIELLLGLKAAGINANIIGDFGSGKSSMIYAMGEKLGCHVVMKSLNKMDTTDFSGVPYLSEEMGVEYNRNGEVVKDSNGKPKLVRIVKNSPSPFIRELLENPNSILFLDEINRAAPALQSAALTLIQDGDAGDVRISKSVWRVAAMNAFDVGVNSFSMAAANRFCHIYHKADPEVFANGIVTGFAEEPSYKVNPEKDILEKRLQYRIGIGNFIRENPQYLSVVSDDMSDNLAFPTPRTWEMVIEILAHLDCNTDQYVNTLVYGCVGKEAGKLALKYLKDKLPKTVDLSKYLGKEDKFVLPNPDKVDEVWNIVQALQYWFQMKPKEYFNLWKRIICVLHNRGKKYGSYSNYDNFIMSYWYKNVPLAITCLDDKAKGISQLREDLEGAFEIFTV